jgi:hypothetical protein
VEGEGVKERAISGRERREIEKHRKILDLRCIESSQG